MARDLYDRLLKFVHASSSLQASVALLERTSKSTPGSGRLLHQTQLGLDYHPDKTPMNLEHLFTFRAKRNAKQQ